MSVTLSLISAGSASLVSLLSASTTTFTSSGMSEKSPEEIAMKAMNSDPRPAKKKKRNENTTKKGNKKDSKEVNAAFQGVDLDASYPRQEPLELPCWHLQSETLPFMASEESINQLEFWENKPVLHSGHKLDFDKKDT
eukprot:Seg2427.9 transcript_id=Seg2427.9/GoldUCD/mRNA.D3Y31 product="hypothetical protein" protein_id=Seg2427.9/GoldUCD/D3Y31